MKGRTLVIWWGVAAAAALVVLILHRACDRKLSSAPAVPPAETDAKQPTRLPPLVVDKTAPLLLEGPGEQTRDPQKAPANPPADNQPCFVCHDNYKGESLVKQHADQSVGCRDCHGESYAHRNDENNTTPPDIMYPASLIDELCQTCHDSHNVSAREVIALFQERSALHNNLETVMCTDCHGEHRLKLRSVRWDKDTGQLILRARNS